MLILLEHVILFQIESWYWAKKFWIESRYLDSMKDSRKYKKLKMADSLGAN